MTVLFDQPLGILAGGEDADGVPGPIDNLEDAAVLCSVRSFPIYLPPQQPG